MKSLIIFDIDRTLYFFDGSKNNNFQSSNFYIKTKERAYNFITKKLNVDKNIVKKLLTAFLL